MEPENVTLLGRSRAAYAEPTPTPADTLDAQRLTVAIDRLALALDRIAVLIERETRR